MVCPFRVGVAFEYITKKDKDGNNEYLEKEQRAVYPPCYLDECPYYDGFGGCKRIEDD